MIPRRPSALAALVVLAVAAAPAIAAQKVDTLTFRNGDRVTGEIKRMSRGELEYATSQMGTVGARWTYVVRIESPRFFELTVRSGARYYGALRATPDTGRVVVHVAQFADTVRLDSIVDIVPIGQGLLRRVNGYLDLGLTFAKANSNTQFTLGAEARYRTRGWLGRVTGESYYQKQASTSATRRTSLTLFGQRYLSGLWGIGGSASLENNEELSLDLRGTVAVAAGLALQRSTETLITAYAGLAGTQEDYSGVDRTHNLEGVVALEGNIYRFGARRVDVSTRAQALPSLSDLGRVRVEVDVRVSYELLRDFTLGLTIYDDFDSRPPDGSGSANDYGSSFTVGWTF
jgi:hypothetical protein